LGKLGSKEPVRVKDGVVTRGLRRKGRVLKTRKP